MTMSDENAVAQSGQESEKSGLSGAALDSLGAIAGEEAQAFDDIEQDAQQAAAKDAAREEDEAAAGWLQAVDAAADMITAPFPEAESVWTKTRKENLAMALARCDAIYGWGGVGGIFGHPLVGLAIASFPLAIGTVKAINAAKPPKRQKLAPGAIMPDAMASELVPQPA
jgi:hypothetical protein